MMIIMIMIMIVILLLIIMIVVVIIMIVLVNLAATQLTARLRPKSARSPIIAAITPSPPKSFPTKSP